MPTESSGPKGPPKTSEMLIPPGTGFFQNCFMCPVCGSCYNIINRVSLEQERIRAQTENCPIECYRTILDYFQERERLLGSRRGSYEAPVIGSVEPPLSPTAERYGFSRRDSDVVGRSRDDLGIRRSSVFKSTLPQPELFAWKREDFERKATVLLKYPLPGINSGTDEKIYQFIHVELESKDAFVRLMQQPILSLLSPDLLQHYRPQNFPYDTIENVSAAGLLFAPIRLDLDPMDPAFPSLFRIGGMWRKVRHCVSDQASGQIMMCGDNPIKDDAGKVISSPRQTCEHAGFNNLTGSWWANQMGATRTQHRHIFALNTAWNAMSGTIGYKPEAGSVVLVSLVTPQVQTYIAQEADPSGMISKEKYILYGGGGLQFNAMRVVQDHEKKVPPRLFLKIMKWTRENAETSFLAVDELYEIAMLVSALRMLNHESTIVPISLSEVKQQGKNMLLRYAPPLRNTLRTILENYKEIIVNYSDIGTGMPQRMQALEEKVATTGDARIRSQLLREIAIEVSNDLDRQYSLNYLIKRLDRLTALLQTETGRVARERWRSAARMVMSDVAAAHIERWSRISDVFRSLVQATQYSVGARLAGHGAPPDPDIPRSDTPRSVRPSWETGEDV